MVCSDRSIFGLRSINSGKFQSAGSRVYAVPLHRRASSSSAFVGLAEATRNGAKKRAGNDNCLKVRQGFTVNSVTTTTNYLYDGDNIIEELDQNGNSVARYTQGSGIDEHLAESHSGITAFYEADGLGSITSLINSAGAITDTYDSFGNLTASSGSTANPFRYTGRELEPETGLYYYRARYYDASVGRFLSEDPLGFGAGSTNFYSYVFNNPVNFSDPSGKVCIYSQTTGKMRCFAACMKPPRQNACSLPHYPNMKPYYDEQGYSGAAGEHRNNEFEQDDSGEGAIPRGIWITRGPWHNRIPGPGRNVMDVYPMVHTDDCFDSGRDCSSFRLHGDNSRHDASHGCIILPPNRITIPSNEPVYVTE